MEHPARLQKAPRAEPAGGGAEKEKSTSPDARPDFYLMEIISIIHLTAGGLCRQSRQTITNTVQLFIQTNEWNIPHNSKLALVLLPRD